MHRNNSEGSKLRKGKQKYFSCSAQCLKEMWLLKIFTFVTAVNPDPVQKVFIRRKCTEQ